MVSGIQIVREYRDQGERNFSGVDLSGISIRRVSLVSCSFNRAKLHQAKFKDVKFLSCHFSDAILTGVKLDNVTADLGSLIDADLSMVEITGSKIFQFNAAKAKFSGAIIKWSDFSETDFRRATFNHCKIFLSNFSMCNLSEVDFSGSEIDAKFAGANLSRVNFKGCRFVRGRFDNANLFGVNFEGVNLSSLNIFYETPLANAYYEEIGQVLVVRHPGKCMYLANGYWGDRNGVEPYLKRTPFSIPIEAYLDEVESRAER